ncbi:hypothetical protein RTCIAT899_PC09215 (plasmid) [Rhizobium tropici CIAT 899]|nr:hypothetical protein RTCIAT899_PC09215 [Rhizobium tropici CIAT 899]
MRCLRGFLSFVRPPIRSLKMGQVATKPLSDLLMEILPPEHDEESRSNGTACLCCRRQRSARKMDEDGCGICDECLAP